ncbi:MAG: hypothetical protein E6J51_13350 [Chloroflexi bacterium]|nr:MAG: hypothetical protein E6J51_13350 [Chloroflexota bacterium]
MDYTAVGQTTHLAARMEQLADPGTIVITPDTLALAEGYVEVKSLGPVPVKGLADAVEVYELTGAGPARTRLQAAARRGLTRFVGRDAELEQLRRAQQFAGAGHGQVAALVGEAGVGKSRLVYEFTDSHRLQGWLVLESASVSYGKATSYWPVIDLLKGYFKIQDRSWGATSHRFSNGQAPVSDLVSALSGQRIGLRGHDEVVPMKATDLVGPPGDRDTPPLGEEGGMVTLFLGEGADPVREAQRVGEVRELEDPLEPGDPFTLQ